VVHLMRYDDGGTQADEEVRARLES
jgi:hypothetical protein